MDWMEIVFVFLLSSVKFFFGGVPMALGFGFSAFESITVTCLGGFTGVVTFVFLSEKVIAYYRRRAAFRRAAGLAPRKKKFTRRNRMIITIKNKFGLVGFAFLVPVFIPIPIGCFLTVRYFNDKQKILRSLFAAIVFWSVVGTYLYKPLFDAIRHYIL
ncbi:MAG: hypothetical protein ACJ77K_16990 [Bacteroidia bacterium]